MLKRILPYFVISFLIIGLGSIGCTKKSNTLGIDNDRVIKTPYSVYAANIGGQIITTTDGINFQDLFPPDGRYVNAMITAGENLLVLKQNLSLAKNRSQNFNLSFDKINHFPWQTIVYNYRTFERLYATSTKGKGIYFSEDNGISWAEDKKWVDDDLLPPSFEISSFSGLTSGKLFAYSNVGQVLFVKKGVDANWEVQSVKGAFPVGVESEYYLISNNNTLFLVDYHGIGGAWYSDDEGEHWTKYNKGDMPASGTTKFLSAISPNDEGNKLLVGTNGFGVFESNGDIFLSASGGLEKGTISYSFTNKLNRYKNDEAKRYVYLGTNEGLYRSENGGKTWYLLTVGERRQAYVAIY